MDPVYAKKAQMTRQHVDQEGKPLTMESFLIQGKINVLIFTIILLFSK